VEEKGDRKEKRLGGTFWGALYSSEIPVHEVSKFLPPHSLKIQYAQSICTGIVFFPFFLKYEVLSQKRFCRLRIFPLYNGIENSLIFLYIANLPY
jgi:prepilin signal peptidase PulO-like enzyme (type II secretory pathway)